MIDAADADGKQDKPCGLSKGPSLGVVGVIGRFKPLHKSGALMLDTLCERAERVVIGIGSSNKYNLRNPFTAQEIRGMLEAYLSPRHKNYSIIEVSDYAQEERYRDGQEWRKHVLEQFNGIDAFVTGNAYVAQLLADDYPIIHPTMLIPREKWIRMRATDVRLRMAQGDCWRGLVPEEVVGYLEGHHLVERFCREFGLATLAALVDYVPGSRENAEEEYLHTAECGAEAVP